MRIGRKKSVRGLLCNVFAFACCVIGTSVRGSDVDAAVDNAAKFLLSRQLPNGTWGDYGGHRLGETSLVGLAVVHGGKQRSPQVVKAGQIVRNYCGRNADTYDTALAVMFLDSLGKSGDKRLLAFAGERIASGQLGNAAWSYGIPGEGQADFRNTLAGGDNSCTQFGVLGCWVARRHGAATDDALRNAGAYFRKSVDPSTGGWGYTANAGATASMTCAGLLGLAAAEGVTLLPGDGGRAERQNQKQAESTPPQQNPFEPSRLKRPRAERKDAVEEKTVRPPRPVDPVVQRAFAYLAEKLRSNPGLANDYYFMWSLERVGVIYGAETIGGVDWYNWGIEHLLAAQRPDGSWQGSYGSTIDTSFAVLFLTRANMAGDLTAKLQGSGDPVSPGKTGGGNQLFKRIQRSPTNPSVTEPPTTDGGKKQAPAKKVSPFQPN